MRPVITRCESLQNHVQVVTVLKKEVMRTQSKELERAFEYRQLLVQAIHKCAIRFPDVAGNVLHLLMGQIPVLQ